MLYNKLKNTSPQQFSEFFADEKSFSSLLSKLKLSSSISREDLVKLLLAEIKQYIKSERKKEALYLLKLLKKVLPLVPIKYKVDYYLQLADYFILSNDYSAAEKAVNKAKISVSKLTDPERHIKVLNMLFIIARTLKNDDAINYLLKSKQLSEKHKIYDNLVFCEVNIGLIHLFNKEYTKAAECAINVVSLVSKHKFSKEKILMTADFFLHLFSESPGFFKVPKYHDTILKGINIVLEAIDLAKDEYYATRRLSILVNTLLLSEELVEKATKIINHFVEKKPKSQKAYYYSAIATGFSDYMNYKMAIVYLRKALEYIKYVNDDKQREIRKQYAFILSKALNINMIYDLQSSTNIAAKLTKITIELDKDTLLEKKGAKIIFANAIAESDAIFGIKRDMIVKKLFNSIKEQCTIVKAISHMSHSKSREDLISSVEPVVIVARGHNTQEISALLLVGSSLDEKTAKRKTKIFEGYQIIGHIVPSSRKHGKHWEDFDVDFLYELLTAPQKYSKIEILTVSDNVEVQYKAVFNK